MSNAVPQEFPIYHDLSQASVPREKLHGYLLDLDHPEGGGKAKFFLARGFSRDELEVFASALRVQGTTNPVERYKPNEFGRKIIVRCSVVTPDGLNPCIVSVWMEDGSDQPRLVTAYPG